MGCLRLSKGAKDKKKRIRSGYYVREMRKKGILIQE